MAPSPPRSCWRARWCSCRDFGGPIRRPSVPSWTTRISEKAMCWYPSRLRKPGSRHLAIGRPSPSRWPFATRLVPAPPQSFFSAETHTLHKPPHGGLAEALSGETFQEAAPLANGGRGPVAYVVRYGGPSASFPWGKRLPSVGEFGVTLDRGEADGEKAGGLGLGRATLLDSFDYFLA